MYLLGGVGLHQLGSLMPVVELVGGSIGIPAAFKSARQQRTKSGGSGCLLPFGEDENVAVPAERIGEDGCTRFQSAIGLLDRGGIVGIIRTGRAEVDIAVVAWKRDKISKRPPALNDEDRRLTRCLTRAASVKVPDWDYCGVSMSRCVREFWGPRVPPGIRNSQGWI